ncbi:Tol-Pal system protein TolB [Hydrogenimonas thermophila]|uniref:TolB protein n=1 Tax=Hydrogenimonas thermophila TaxID=223786 RepID=A0A1I5SK72_9BACT|nr:Tol-Pal system protein TolB [Hydrogenimonas thermophila]WOE70880.1 Tol-Pal system protein TolB [Hydrogenimonas thermophila]WOE73398.1 Tol-Pal system protein TolB [Hydrogenimonas thermophila]SFP70766.1 TolB protein [Hydrogenimonas thermophila]
MRYLLILCMGIFLYGADATLEIVKNVDNRPSITIEDSSSFGNSYVKKKFFRLVLGDLKVTSHFKVDDTYRVTDYNSPINPIIKQNRYLVRYSFKEGDGQRLILDFKVYDLRSKTWFFERRYRVSNRVRYPFLIHQAVIDFNDSLGLPSVGWMKRYVVLSQYTKSKQSKILIADYTLTYRKTIISGGLNIFPKWADREQKGIYYTKIGRKPILYYYNIYTGKRHRVASSDGMIICSDVSRDGKKLLLTKAPNGQPDIYLYNILNGRQQRLTFYSGIDVSGQFVDGERGVVFVSDRLGNPNIFKLEIGQRGVSQLVYHGRNNSSCTAQGKYIVYTSRESNNAFSSNTFNLYLASTKSDYIRRLTASGINQFPKLSQDGKSVLYIKHYASQSALGIIRLEYNEGFLFPLTGLKIQSIDW